MEDIVISSIRSSSPKYAQVWDVREAILRVPLGLSLKNDDLSRDHGDDIFIAEINGLVVGCLLAHPLGGDIVQLRAMAVYDEWQGKGIGRLLVRAAERFCRDNGTRKIMLHARKVAMGFYTSLGYTVEGEEFTEVGIPHFIMVKELGVMNDHAE